MIGGRLHYRWRRTSCRPLNSDRHDRRYSAPFEIGEGELIGKLRVGIVEGCHDAHIWYPPSCEIECKSISKYECVMQVFFVHRHEIFLVNINNLASNTSFGRVGCG